MKIVGSTEPVLGGGLMSSNGRQSAGMMMIRVFITSYLFLFRSRKKILQKHPTGTEGIIQKDECVRLVYYRRQSTYTVVKLYYFLYDCISSICVFVIHNYHVHLVYFVSPDVANNKL